MRARAFGGVWEIRVLGGLYQDRGVFHLWPDGTTPDADADLTERALLDQVGRRPPFAVLASGLAMVLLVALSILILFGYPWIEGLFR
jgi:hypothetical protein